MRDSALILSVALSALKGRGVISIALEPKAYDDIAELRNGPENSPDAEGYLGFEVGGIRILRGGVMNFRDMVARLNETDRKLAAAESQIEGYQLNSRARENEIWVMEHLLGQLGWYKGAHAWEKRK